MIRCARGVIAAAQGLEGCDLSEQLVAIGVDLLELRLVPVALRIQQIEVTEGAAVVAELRQLTCTRQRGNPIAFGGERDAVDLRRRQAAGASA